MECLSVREDYKAAKKLAEAAVSAAQKNGVSPYLPVLEDLGNSLKEVRLGLMELPLSRITGNKEQGRNNAFANNFMPLLEEGSEFAVKWSNLYDSFLEEGIRDAIKVYEYMNRYYVQEGNKRVSVSMYGGMEFILADVIRIIPEKSESKEYMVYSEYLDFYDCTGNYYIIFSEPGEYSRLAGLLGLSLDREWPEEVCADLKCAYFSFCRKCRSELKIADYKALSEAFLMYVSIFPMKTLFRDTEEQVIKNIRSASKELLAGSKSSEISFLEAAPEAQSQKTSVFSKLFSGTKKYTSSSPLRVAFVYDADIEQSRWIDSHEAGRLYVDEMTGSNVVTRCYLGTEKNIEETVGKAVADKNEIIFTVSDRMMPDTLKAAVQNPGIKFLNCSLGNSRSSVRCYQGKLYEATFLMGILAADRLLLERTEGDRKIGYIVRSGADLSVAELNAFAVGASLIDPECRIVLRYANRANDTSFRGEFLDEGIHIYADFDQSSKAAQGSRPGLYLLGRDKDIYLGSPYYSWGKYYVQIVQSVLSGAWDVGEKMKYNNSANYWFGLSTGVVDIRTKNLGYQTSKLLAFFKDSIVNGGFGPFSGELHSQSGAVIHETSGRSSAVSLDQVNLEMSSIAFMDWLNENIDGELPSRESK